MESLLGYITMINLIGAICLNIVLFVTLSKRYYQTKVTATLLLLSAVVIGLFTESLELLTNFQNFDNLVANYYGISSITFNFLGILSAGMYLLFIDFFENESISASRLTVFSSVVFGYTFSSFFILGFEELVFSDLSLRDPSYGFLVSVGYILGFLITPIFLIYVIIVSFRSIADVKRHAIDKDQKTQLELFSLVIIFYYLITTISSTIGNTLLITNIVPTDEVVLLLLAVIPRTSVNIGSLLLWWTYAHSTRAAILQPQRMDKLVVIAKSGLPLYSYDFPKLNSSDNVMDEALLSGGMSAIRSLLKEAVGTSSDVVSIRFKQKEIMIASHSEFGVFLIVDRPSLFLRRALISFSDIFKDKFTFDPILVDDSVFKGADVIVRKTFGIE